MALFFSLFFYAYGVKKGVLHDNCLVVNFSCSVNFLQKKTWERVKELVTSNKVHKECARTLSANSHYILNC
jgi:hypothetical protein